MLKIAEMLKFTDLTSEANNPRTCNGSFETILPRHRNTYFLWGGGGHLQTRKTRKEPELVGSKGGTVMDEWVETTQEAAVITGPHITVNDSDLLCTNTQIWVQMSH